MQRIQESTLGSDGALKSGTAFMIDERGYMITNEHVIKDSRYVEVEFTWEGKTKTFPAKVVYKDAETDLAILRIISNDFKTNGALPFSILKDNVLVGSEVFTLGYPEALIIMGKEVKFTDGKISALSGIKNNKMVYQTTIPARGGNSGGAVFDNNGNIVGVLSSGRTGSEIVSYVIKSSVLINFIKQFNSDIVIKRPINLSKLPLTSKIKHSPTMLL
ncbi:MAG: trypsin-like peptidase domain-containing protein [Saprospiraceae bacterium]|nr:trypsin-like peptidase domain-containing protein [Candidatus Brachybacter algidus]